MKTTMLLSPTMSTTIFKANAQRVRYAGCSTQKYHFVFQRHRRFGGGGPGNASLRYSAEGTSHTYTGYNTKEKYYIEEQKICTER